MLEGVTIEQLRTLRAVAEAGSFSAAARKLGRVQAAVSQSIDRLEAQLGLRLFDRSGRVPRLTQHGEAVVAAAARVEGGVEALDELVATLKRGAETTLRDRRRRDVPDRRRSSRSRRSSRASTRRSSSSSSPRCSRR